MNRAVKLENSGLDCKTPLTFCQTTDYQLWITIPYSEIPVFVAANHAYFIPCVIPATSIHTHLLADHGLLKKTTV